MWIIMPAISGDLRSALMSREFSNNTNYKLALQAATAVSYLHSRAQPILDVNIHAYNILFQAPDKILLIVKPMLLLAVYTVDWSAPETQQENPNWTPKADVYGLGMLFWEILTKSKVDFGYNSFEVAARIRSGERPVIPDTCPPVRLHINNFILTIPRNLQQLFGDAGTKIQMSVQHQQN